MSSTPKMLMPIILMVVAIVIEDCTGIVYNFKGRRMAKPRRRPRLSVCRFGQRNYTVGHSWHPNLLPQGINYCITCKCQKRGLTRCSRIKCKQVTCPGVVIPPGKCCPVCPVSTTDSQKYCYHEGMRYNARQLWEVPMKKKNRMHNNCAECICYNGKISCTIRICPALKCLKLFQVKEKDSCCMKCTDLPLKPDGVKKQEGIADRLGSCFSNGRYYENMDMWNPAALTTDLKFFQHPNCDICSCQNSNVTCKNISCPNLKCKKPIQKDPQDCCMSCPGDVTRPIPPIINGSFPLIPQPTQSKASYYPGCKFGEKVYQHNMTWSPLIPGLKPSHCVRCTCMFSRVKCDRIICKTGGSCAQNCSTVSSSTAKIIETTTTAPKECSKERVQVHLLVKVGGRKARTKHPSQFNYLVKIALLKTKSSSVEIHHWSVNNNKATVRTSKVKSVRFAKRKLSYTSLGEAKIGRMNRFLNKEKLLVKCNRNCKNKAKDYVNSLKNRIRYFKNDCRLTDTFRRLDQS